MTLLVYWKLFFGVFFFNMQYVFVFSSLRNYVLRLTDSIGDAGVFRWEILLCLLAAWIGVYFCMWKGVKSSGKVTLG